MYQIIYKGFNERGYICPSLSARVQVLGHSDILAVYILVFVATVRRRRSIKVLGEEIPGEGETVKGKDVEGGKPEEGDESVGRRKVKTRKGSQGR